MNDLDDEHGSMDGRVARRERNIEAVLDVALELFAEEALFPSIDDVAERSGLSLRSIYRYFAEPSELLEAAIRHDREKVAGLAHLSAIGEGPLSSRIDDFVAMRLRLYERVGPAFRATVANSVRHPRIRDAMARNRNELRQQFELQFAREVEVHKPAEREAVIAAGDVVSQLESIDFLRRHRQFSVVETEKTLRHALHALLDS